MPAPWACDARGKAPEKTVGQGQVTQVVGMTHGQEALDVATFSQLPQLVDQHTPTI